ncbi:ADP compounds hydrolase NudE [Pelagibaculum spongiae]|uniref:ADP compounds hydrolase NudE n=1 Tax=Pelagibaculum spongiae TaxID=2080658 RepID=A0A2V1GZ79_9GAMM|nr:ADP compounds hydrolase NudE [Pelagibaculum spongiae]PVZ68366.1 ADP compounds hydrolase NudE [Pelagibaculum spongiae]
MPDPTLSNSPANTPTDLSTRDTSETLQDSDLLKRLLSSRQGPKIHQRQRVADSRLFHIEAIDLEFSNGETRQYERLVGKGYGAVMVAAVTTDHQVILVKEYAAGTECYELGLPKGLVDPGEDHLTAANRELMEETGFAAKSVTKMTEMSLAPAYMSHKIQLLLAQDIYPQTAKGDEPEPPEVVFWPINKLDLLIQSGQCTEARSLAGLFMLRDKLANL